MNYLRNNDTGAQYNFDSAPMNQNALALDYSSPIEIGGVGKGYRVKGDPYTAILADGRTVRMGGDSEATNKLQMAQLAMEDKRQNLRAGELDIKTKQAQLDGSKRPAAPPGYMWNQEGSGVVPIPGFEDGGKPLTEFQGKSATFGVRTEDSDKVLNEVGKNGKVQPTLLSRAVEGWPALEMAANSLPEYLGGPSAQQQQVEQAQRNFTNATLRQESGAAISQSEFDNAKKQYFPQPSDSQEVIDQKNQSRKTVTEGFKVEAGKSGWNQIQKQVAPVRAISEARNAIKNGAPRDAVIQRLQQMGIDTAGF